MVKLSFGPNPDYKYMYDDCAYQMKEQNKSFNQFIEKLVQYESYWLSFSVLAEFFHIGRVCNQYDAG